MTRVPVWQTAFNAGELSPLILGQFELAKYKNGCKQLINANPMIQGPAQKRNGSYYTATSKNNGLFWMFEFIYDRFDSYVVEAGPNYFRFYRNRAQVVTGGGQPYTLSTPYSWSNLTDTNDGTLNLRIFQSADVIYICTNDGSLPAYTLTRIADNNWTLAPYTAVGGPFQPENITATTVYASAQTGSVTLTASAPIFNAAHVGMLFKMAPSTLQYLNEWEPNKQIFLNQRIRANGNTYLAVSPTPVGVPWPGSSIGQGQGGSAQANLATAIAVDIQNGNTAPYLAAVEVMFTLVGGLPANYAGINTALNVAVAAGGTPAAIATAQTAIYGLNGLLGAWSGAGAGLYTGTVQPTHDDSVRYDGTGTCADPFTTVPAVVACGVAWQFEDPGYGVVLITSVPNSTTAVGTVQPFRAGLINTPALPFFCTSIVFPTTNWAFGAWGTAAGANNPSNVAFYRNRLCFGAANGFFSSVSLSFNEFYATTNGQTLPDNAISTYIEEQGAQISWMLPLDALSIGTAGGEVTCAEQNISNAFGPTNIKITPQTNYGSHGSTPIRIGNAIFFIDATGVILRKIENNQQSAWTGQNSAPSQVDLAEHILKPGCIQIKYAPLPFPAIIAPRYDGVVAHFSYDKDEEIFAWSKYFLGGHQDDARSLPAKVFCCATIPNPQGNGTDIYLGVERRVNNATLRTIEIIREQLAAPVRMPVESKDSWLRRLNDWQCDQFRVDCGLTHDAPVAVTAMALTNPLRITAPGHGFANGTHARLDGITSAPQLNARKFTVSNATANTFTINFDGTQLAPFAAFTAPFGSGPVVRQYVSAVSGLAQLIGETVAVCVDGAAHPPVTVDSAGRIALKYPGCRVHAGQAYSMILDILAPPAPGQSGHTEGTVQHVDHIIVRFNNTLGGWFGSDVDSLKPVNFRAVTDPLGLASPAFTGIKFVEIDEDWDRERSLTFVHSDPLPCTVCAMGYIIDAEEDVAK